MEVRMVDPVAGTLVTASIELVTRLAPKGLAWAKTRLAGRKILVVGPVNAGKSSFTHYLRFGILEQPGNVDVTIEVEKSLAFKLAVGKNQEAVLEVKHVLDTPGHLGPIAHADLVAQHRPHALVVVLDCDAPAAETTKWLDDFSTRLDTVFRSTRGLTAKLKSIEILANKADLHSAGHVEGRIGDVKAVLKRELKGALGAERIKRIHVRPCILIHTERGAELADTAIRSMVKALVK